MTKSKIEQELDKDYYCNKGNKTKHYTREMVLLTIQNALKDLEKKKIINAFYHNGNGQDCVKWSDVIEAFGEVKK